MRYVVDKKLTSFILGLAILLASNVLHADLHADKVNYSLTGAAAKTLSQWEIPGCVDDRCDFIDHDEFVDFRGSTVILIGDTSASGMSSSGSMYWNHFADHIYEFQAANPNRRDATIHCIEELVPFPSPLPAFHHKRTCELKGSLQIN